MGHLGSVAPSLCIIISSSFNPSWMGGWSAELTENILCIPDASLAKSAGGPSFEFMEICVHRSLFIFSVPVGPFFQQF